MRNLPVPAIDDSKALVDLSKSRAVSARAIAGQLTKIAVQFEAYALASGDPWQVNADATLVPFRDHLESLYESPPVALKHVPTIRGGLTGSCPMCGRDALGTIDHYLPQADYPEFSFYSKNLVPACSRCNTMRSNSVKGDVAGKRALQPYFDLFAANRVMSVELTPDFRAPAIRPVPFNVNGAVHEIVQWQIEKVVIPSGFVQYAAPIWGTFVDNPLSILDPDPTAAAVLQQLNRLERYEIATNQSPNAWKACILHGIQQRADAVQYIAGRVAAAMAARIA